MPTIPADAPRGNFKFYDQPVTLPLVYAAGQTLDDNLAKFLNQQVATTVGNRFGAQVRKELEVVDAERAKAAKEGTYTGPTVDVLDAKGNVKGTKPAPATAADLGWDFQARIEEVFANFTPGVSARGGGGSGTSADPVAAEIRRLAGVAVRDVYKAKGVNYQAMLKATKEDGRSAYAHHVDQYVELKHDQLKAIVEAQFAAMNATKDVADELDLGAEAA